MLKHVLLIALRNMKRSKAQFFIHLIGLSSGLACAVLIYLWVADEFKTDRFHKNERRLFSVMQNYHFPNGDQTWNMTPTPLAPAMVAELPEVEMAVSINPFIDWFKGPGVVTVDKKTQVSGKGIFASKDFFKVFTYPLLHGNPAEALIDKKSVAISEALAMKLFNRTDVVDQTLEWNHRMFQGPFRVSAVYANIPPNSTKQFDIIFNYDILKDEDIYSDAWNANYAETYILTKEELNVEQFNRKIASFLRKKNPDDDKTTLFVQKYSDVYLHGRYEDGKQVGGRIEYVRLFSLIAFFVLIIACINFTNLSTANGALKSREVGVKKTLGIGRGALVFQFLFESILMAVVSCIVAFTLVYILLPEFNVITGKQISINFSTRDLLMIGSLVLLTGVVAGAYPAFYLSGFNPAAVLKRFSGEKALFRKALVIVQFSISIIFVVGFMVVHKQIGFVTTMNLGYQREHVITFRRQGPVDPATYPAFVTELKRIPTVVNASSMFGSIITEVGGNSGFVWDGQNVGEKEMSFPSPMVSHDFIETLSIPMKQGRTFSADYTNENEKVIINEAAVKLMGFDSPIGKIIQFGQQQLEVIGVTKDFHYGSLHNGIAPLIFRYSPARSDMVVRIEAGKERETIEKINEVYRTFHPNYIFDFSFMDSEYQALYISDTRVNALLTYFTLVAIIISCLGLFGLASFVSQRRVKEICIRKVYGSSVTSLMLLLSTSFTQTVLMAIVIALPVSYFILESWLTQFAYRIPFSWTYFAVAAVFAIVIAWLTIGFIVFSAASVNPIKGLKQE